MLLHKALAFLSVRDWRKLVEGLLQGPKANPWQSQEKNSAKSWLTTTVILLLILPLQINWNIRIHPLLYHWSALQPLAKYPRQSWKVQPNEWFNWQKFRCKMSGLPKDAKQVSEQADGWRAGLQQVRSHRQPRWGCLLVFRQLQSYLQHRKRKGTKSRKSSDCNTQQSPKGVQRRVTWAIRGTKGPASDKLFKKPSISAWPGND